MRAVLDTNVIVRGRKIDFEEIFILPEVLEEVESTEGENKLRNLDYEVEKFSEKDYQNVMQKSEEINSPTSKNDEKLLALAISVDGTLITDDKPLQNLALHLGVDFQGFLDEPTDQKFKWVSKCEGCGYEAEGSNCPRCGSQIRERQVSCS